VNRPVTLAVAQPLRRRPGQGEAFMTVDEHLAQSIQWVRLAPAGSDILYFPEQARGMALAGAEILFHPTRTMNHPSEKGFEALCLARAVENVCWFAWNEFRSLRRPDLYGALIAGPRGKKRCRA
jgi:hypothetical protein